MSWTPDEIDLAFCREFSTVGTQIHGPMSSAQRRDRIRVEIWRHHRTDQQFFDSGMTYAGAFRAAYGISVEARRTARLSVESRHPQER